MQHSSQEPERQTDHAPSEIYQFAQQQEDTQPPTFTRGIAVYANRRQAVWRTILIGILGAFLVLLLVIFSIALVALASAGLPGGNFAAGLLSLLGFLFITILAEVVWIGWMIWRWYSTLLANREPILVIDHRGITVRSTPSLSGFFIAWPEIESIRVQSFLYKYLCIRARNEKQFLKRFNPFERFIRLSNSICGISPLLIPQVFLDRPVEEVMQRLYYEHMNELSYYRVQLLP